jgi:hypothetical protein
MGLRFRLKASFNVTTFPSEVQVILNALKQYGAFVADTGTAWHLSGSPDTRWNDANLHTLTQVLANNLEAVNESSLQVEANSAAAAGSALALAGIYLDQREVGSGGAVNAEAILTGAAPSGGAVIAITNSNTAAVTVPGSVTIPAGSMSVPVAVTVKAITQKTPVVLSSTYKSVTQPSPVLLVDGGSGTAAPALSALNITPATIAGGNYLTGTVTLTSSAPAGGTSVALFSSSSTIASVPVSVLVPAGAASVSFLVTTYPQTSSSIAGISATLNGESLRIPVTVTTAGASPVTLSKLVVTPTTAAGGSPLTGTVTLSGPAPAGGTLVALSSSNIAAAATPLSVNVPANASTATFTVTTFTQTSNATAVINASLEGVTDSVTVTITSGAVAPAITAQPSSRTVCVPASVTFTAAASGIPTPTAQWQVSGDGVKWTNETGVTSTTPSMTFDTQASQNGNLYRAVFTNSMGSAASNSATLTANTAPAVTSNPANRTVTVGQSVSFTATASGTPTPTVQWQLSGDGIKWINETGVTSTTTTMTFDTQASQNGNLYRALFTGVCGTAASASASLTVTAKTK